MGRKLPESEHQDIHAGDRGKVYSWEKKRKRELIVVSVRMAACILGLKEWFCTNPSVVFNYSVEPHRFQCSF